MLIAPASPQLGAAPQHDPLFAQDHPVRDAAATVMPDYGEAPEPKHAHDFDLIGCHGALAIVHMALAAFRLCGVAIAAASV